MTKRQKANDSDSHSTAAINSMMSKQNNIKLNFYKNEERNEKKKINISSIISFTRPLRRRREHLNFLFSLLFSFSVCSPGSVSVFQNSNAIGWQSVTTVLYAFLPNLVNGMKTTTDFFGLQVTKEVFVFVTQKKKIEKEEKKRRYKTT